MFSLAPILPDLHEDARKVTRELERAGIKVTVSQVIITWVMFQLERYLYLNLEMSPQRIDAHRLSILLPAAFLHSHMDLRDLLIAQIQPVLIRGKESPYTERFCRVEIRLPDLQMHFL